jgi:hypothetical protein
MRITAAEMSTWPGSAPFRAQPGSEWCMLCQLSNSCGLLPFSGLLRRSRRRPERKNPDPALLPRYCASAATGVRSDILTLPRCGTGVHWWHQSVANAGRGKPPRGINLSPPPQGHWSLNWVAG